MSETNDAVSRQWGTLKLSTGFNLADLVRSVVQFADSREAEDAIRRVAETLTDGCSDGHQWHAVIAKLGNLLDAHPDRLKESGTWYDGDASILALAVAQDAARVGLKKLYPTLHQQAEIDGMVYKVFKYMLRAMAQKPETATTCLKWVESALNLQPK